MYKFFTLYLILCFSNTISSQVTLVRSGPNDTINLNCAGCNLTVVDMALTKGQQSVPIDLRKPVKTNLFHWKYFDEIAKEEVQTETEPRWTKGVQLVETMPESEMLSLHINFEFVDSIGTRYKIFMVLGGLTRHNLSDMPMKTVFEGDTYAPLRFAAIAQTQQPDGRKETYDSIEGTCTLEALNLRARSVRGIFEFVGNRIGIAKRNFFLNGQFIKG